MRHVLALSAGKCLLLVLATGVLLDARNAARAADPPRSPTATTVKSNQKDAPPPPVLAGPEVMPDGRVRFVVFAPQAKAVKVTGEFAAGETPLTNDGTGLWAAMVGSVAPGLYGYSFIIDGQKLPDPNNAWVKPSRYVNTSVLLVPGDPKAIFEEQGHPAGTVHLHTYHSKNLDRLRPLRVYTPPGYETSRARYPVVYLMHGFSDNEACWTQYGRAHVIADNLIAAKQAVPMIIVMTDGHTVPLERSRWAENLHNLQQDVLTSVIPFVEARYRTKADALHRAVVGLSMGGEQALSLGMLNPDRFAWVGGMSAATRHLEEFAPAFSNVPALNRKLSLLWIAIGKDDFLLPDNRKFVEALNERQIRHEYKETDGAHAWGVWRGYLAAFLPRLFVQPRQARASGGR